MNVTEHREHVTLAWLTAPLVALVTVAVAISCLSLIERPPNSMLAVLTESGELAVVLLLYGAPVAYGVELLVGLPAYQLLTSTNRLGRGPVIFVATMAGFLSFPAVSTLLFVEWDWTVAMIGGLAGAAAGAFFWSVGLSRRQPPAEG